MAKHVIKKDRNEPVDITESNSTWILNKGVKLSGDLGMAISDFDNVNLKIAGSVAATAGIQASGFDVMERTDYIRVNIAKTGSIKATEACAISIEGNDADIVNHGTLRAFDDAVVEIFGDGSTIKNHGKMIGSSSNVIDIYGNGTYDVENHGLITSTINSAIKIEDEGGGTLTNGKDGTIKGLVYLNGSGSNEILAEQSVTNEGKLIGSETDALGVAALMTGDGDDIVINRGTIKGSIWLNGGDDWVNLLKGTLKQGTIMGGEGDDIFVVDTNKVKIVELDEEGYDTIRTTVSYTLADDADIEVLKALGKKALTLTGNDFDNILDGNDANNKLSGGKGIDIFWGNGGNDTMSGGSGADVFYFKENSGVDTITDFSITEDIIRLVKITGFDDFDDLPSHMTMADADNDGQANDTVIDLGDGNKITLYGVNKEMLDADNFDVYT